MPSSEASAAAAKAHYGRYSDGKSAGARDSDVHLRLQGIEIRPSTGTPRAIWPYASLKASEPLRPNAIEALVTSSAEPGASVFVPGSAFASELAKRAPHLTARAERWRHTYPWLAVAAAIAGLIALVYAAGWSPVQSIATMLPDSWRQRLGDHARASMTEGYKQCADPAGLSALDKLAARLSVGRSNAAPVKITVYDWPLLNAFAVPGGQIVMTRGLIEKAGSPDEVAGVLAHEMGHGIALHPETGIIRAIGLAAAVELMMGGSSGALANIGIMLAQLGYTRAAEREADALGLALLRESQIAPQGLADFFARIEQEEGDDEAAMKSLGPLSILRTHPPTAERTALIRAQKPYDATPALDAALWNDLKGICRTTITPDEPAGESTTVGRPT